MEWAKLNNGRLHVVLHQNIMIPLTLLMQCISSLEKKSVNLKKSFNVKVEITRFYNVYGPGENIDEKFGNVIGIWSAKIKKNESIPIVGDGEQKETLFIYMT